MRLALILCVCCGIAQAQGEPPKASEARITAKSGWCVVVGSAPYDAFARAAALATKARAAGAVAAAVYDPRDFDNVALGELVVIEASLDGKAKAQARVKALRRAKLDAHAKECRIAKGTPAAVVEASELRPLEHLGNNPVAFDHMNGCFAWSAAKQQLACVVSHKELLNRTDSELVILGRNAPAELALDDSDANLAERKKHLAGFVALDITRRPLAPGERVEWLTPRFGARWDRGGKISARCGGTSASSSAVVNVNDIVDEADDDTHKRSASASVAVIPGSRFAFIEAQSNAEVYVNATEGADTSSTATAALIDLDTCESF